MWREVDVVYSHGLRKMKRIKTLNLSDIRYCRYFISESSNQYLLTMNQLILIFILCLKKFIFFYGLFKNIIKNSEPNASQNLVQNWFFF